MHTEYCEKCKRVTGTDFMTGFCGGCLMRAYLEQSEPTKKSLLQTLKDFLRLQ